MFRLPVMSNGYHCPEEPIRNDNSALHPQANLIAPIARKLAGAKRSHWVMNGNTPDEQSSTAMAPKADMA